MKRGTTTKNDKTETKFGDSEMINRQRDTKLKSVHDLSFCTKDGKGGGSWWSVSAPKTRVWTVHNELGKAYGLELLDLIHHPDSEVSGEVVGFICGAAGRDIANVSIADGFFETLGKYLVNGDVCR
jgi:hypothetical protein